MYSHCYQLSLPSSHYALVDLCVCERIDNRSLSISFSVESEILANTTAEEMFQRIVVFLVLLWISGVQSRKLQCLDEGGRPVEWFYLYKLPKHVSGEGLDYIYLHPQSGGWKTSEKTIDDPQSIPGSLISQLTSDDLAIMYNDEPPEQKSDETNGHTKGVVAGNSEGGFWLVHSVPKYPPSDYSNYSYPPTGHLYGQSFLCISMNAGDLDSVGSLITYNEPHIYLGQVNPTLQTTYPNLHRLASDGKSWVTEPPFFNSKRVGNLTVFAKAHKFNKELYVDWVAPTLATNLMVESWLHGPGVIGSDCDKPFK